MEERRLDGGWPANNTGSKHLNLKANRNGGGQKRRRDTPACWIVLKKLTAERTNAARGREMISSAARRKYYEPPPGYLFGSSSRSRTNHGRLRNFNRHSEKLFRRFFSSVVVVVVVKLRHTQLIWENRTTTSMSVKRDTPDTHTHTTKERDVVGVVVEPPDVCRTTHVPSDGVAGVKSRKKTGRKKKQLPARDTLPGHGSSPPRQKARKEMKEKDIHHQHWAVG